MTKYVGEADSGVWSEGESCTVAEPVQVTSFCCIPKQVDNSVCSGAVHALCM